MCENEYNSFDSLTMVCAGDLGTNACIGDSGGKIYFNYSFVNSLFCTDRLVLGIYRVV